MLVPAMGDIPYEARRMYLCIDAYQDGEMQGRFYNAFEAQEFRFRALMTLIRHVDELLDCTMLTQRCEERRTLLHCTAAHTRLYAREEWKNFQCPPGELATFLLSISYHQNATWQGEVVWVENRKSSFFRSGLELFRMIDDVLLYQ